ncbi:hypothetical protein DPMN_006708, partial [Dreissena polymorpha]
MHVRLLIAAHVLGVVHMAHGHGYMIDPPARASAWREFPGLPKNFDDNAIRCGGTMIPADGHGRCGVCGDPLGMPQDNEAGGRFATGLIVRHYKMGQTVTMKAILTANHWGWFEFRICPNNDVRKPATIECLDKHVLQRADGLGSRINITTMQTGQYTADYKLPFGMVCSQCVVQWRYHTGNSWGVDPNGKACVGCGQQEEFRGCADVSIDGAGLPVVPTEPSVPTLPPQTYKPVPQTLPPVTTRTTLTSKPPVITPGPTLPRTGCHAINLWSGDSEMDKWCVDNCAIGKCPAFGCSCGNSVSAETPQPTTTSSTTPTTTTTTTMTPRPTTTSTTTLPTTQSTTPSTIATTPQPNPPQTTYITKVVCKAINLWAGNEYLDRWCADSCARGNCAPDSCKCSEVQQVITLTTTQIYTPMATEPPSAGTSSPSVQYTRVCKAISLWKDIVVFDI